MMKKRLIYSVQHHSCQVGLTQTENIIWMNETTTKKHDEFETVQQPENDEAALVLMTTWK